MTIPESGKLAQAIAAYMAGEYQCPEDRKLLAQRIVAGNAERSLARNLIHKEERGHRKALTGSSPFYCARRAAYTLGVGDVKPEPMHPATFTKFYSGDVHEDFFVAAAVCPEAGEYLISPTESGQKKVFRALDSGDQIAGHLDMSIDGAFWGPEWAGQEIPVDVKSANGFSYQRMVREGVTNDFGYLDQLDGVYREALGAPFSVFLLVNKDMGHFSDEVIKPNPRCAERVALSHQKVTECKARGELPPRPRWIKTAYKKTRPNHTIELVTKRCTYCSFRHHCLPDFEMKVVSGRPTFRRPATREEIEEAKNTKKNRAEKAKE